MPRTLSQIKNQYANQIGDIGRKYPTDKKAYDQSRYQLNASTFFHAYQDFIQTTFPEAKKEMEEEKWFVLFRQLVSGCIPDQERIAGTPAETAICAAIDLELKQEQKRSITESKQVDRICKEWGINIHIALQLAVIEWLTNAHNFSQKTTHEKIDISWYTIIKTLLSLGADPNYPCDTFRHQLSPSHFSVATDQLSTAFQLLIFAYDRSGALLDLAYDFLAQQKDRKLTIHPDRMYNALPPVKLSFFMDSGVKFIEKACRDDVASYLSKSLKTIVTKLIDFKDFQSIEYLRSEYKLDIGAVLLEIIDKEPIPLHLYQPTLEHLYVNYKEQLVRYISENQEKGTSLAVTIFGICNLADQGKFDEIDVLRKQLSFNPFDALAQYQLSSTANPWVQTPLFIYLEKNFPEELDQFLQKNLNTLVDKFLNFDVQDEKSLVRLAKFPGIVPVYFEAIDKKYSAFPLGKKESFGEIAKHHDKELLQFFRKDIKISLARKFGDSITELLSTVYNFEWYRAWDSLLDTSNKLLKSFYQQRAKAILDFIFNQKYPLAVAGYSSIFTKTKDLSHNGKTLRLSIALASIVENLDKVVKPSGDEDAAKLFKNVYDTVKYDNSPSIDESERDITKALVSKLTDETELSCYVEQQFLLHRTNPYLQKAPDEKMERKGP